MALSWIPVDGSTRVVAIAYDEHAETIYVRFPDGKEWMYLGWPRNTWDEFSAPGVSKGQFIARVLDHGAHGPHVD